MSGFKIYGFQHSFILLSLSVFAIRWHIKLIHRKHHSVGIQINKLLQPKNNLGRADSNCLGRVDSNCLGHGDPNCLGRGDPNFLTQKIWVGRVCTQNFWVVFDYIFLGRPDPKIFTVKSQATTCQPIYSLPHTVEIPHYPINCWSSSREAVNSNFYSVSFDPTGIRSLVYRFSSRRFIHSTTDHKVRKWYSVERAVICYCWQ